MAKSQDRLYVFLLLLFSSMAFQSCASKSAKGDEQNSSFQDMRKSYSTVLKTRGPAPQEWRAVSTMPGVTEVAYTSGDLKLKAWLAMPKNAQSEKVPAVVYFHGGFAFSMDEFNDCQPFLDAGFAVMIPTLRGENGNPGNFELFYGEIDDARAAIATLAKQPRIDASRIYTFGHSAGGGISALLSLWEDVPIRFGGSSGGLYSKDAFYGWKDFVPFDLSNEKERRLRLLVGNMSSMKRKHIAYLGEDDTLAKVVDAADSEIKKSSAPLTISIIGGDHFSSLDLAVSSFANAIKLDK
ncbi:MAG: acetylxylan esterase [Blastocatellia bacterium]